MESRGMVFVLDGDVDVRDRLLRIAESAGLKCESLATSEEFLDREVPKLDLPCCLVLEMNLPDCSGLELQETLNRRESTIPLIFLAGTSDIPTVVQAMQAGAFDYLPKPGTDARLHSLISRALVVSAQLNAMQSRYKAIRSRIMQLSQRERSVFDLLTKGKSNKEIAAYLSIGVPMVTRHRSRVFRKLGVCNVVELIGLATSYVSGRDPGVSRPEPLEPCVPGPRS
jgi:FixJ family two-component response regulator